MRLLVLKETWFLVTTKEVGVASLYVSPAKGGVAFVPIGSSEAEKQVWPLKVRVPVNE